MKTMINGYIVVLCPKNVGRLHGDTLKPVILNGKPIVYRGLDRDPWWNLDESFYAGQLSNKLVDLRRAIQLSGTQLYSPGVCSDLPAAEVALSASQGCDLEDELIWITNSHVNEIDDSDFLGFDCYVDGFGSLLRLGIFFQSAVFEDFLGRLNQYGIFSNLIDLADYVNAYLNRCINAGLEIVEPKRISDTCSFQVFRVPSAL